METGLSNQEDFAQRRLDEIEAEEAVILQRMEELRQTVPAGTPQSQFVEQLNTHCSVFAR